MGDLLQLRSKLDVSMQGVAGGVGKGKILGKLMDIEVFLTRDLDLNLSFHVLEQPHHLVILGLSTLEDMACIIDLEKRCLRVGGSEGLPVNFLHTHDIPREWNLQKSMMPQNCAVQ